MAEITVTQDNFADEVLKSEIPVLVDFWATWCGPCMMLSPVVEEIAKEYEGRVKVGKINVDEEGALAALYGIQAIPTLILFKNGLEAETKTGYCGKEEIERMLNR